MIGNVPGDFYLFGLYEKLFINMIWLAGLFWQVTKNMLKIPFPGF